MDGTAGTYSCFEKGCPTTPYATIPKGIMGTGVLWSLGLRCFSEIEGNKTNKCIDSCFRVGLISCTSIDERQTLSTHNTNRHCRVRFYAFVGQPLSKQLYTAQAS